MTTYFKKLSKPGKILFIAIASVLICTVASGIGAGIYFAVTTRPYTGVVLEEGTETPLENVSVTDGKNVAVTDKNGRYELKGWHKSKFATVTIPSGYWTEDYYIRRNSDLSSYDFKLRRKDTDETDHAFLQVSDTEINKDAVIGADGVEPWGKDVKNTAERENASFIMHTGDLCYEDGLRKHKEGMNLDNMGVPVRYAMGNHDYVEYGPYGEALFEELYGPAYYSFDVGNVHYIVTPFFGWADRKQRYTLSNAARWLINDIAAVDDDKKIVMFNHDYAPDENEYVFKSGIKKIDLKEEGLIAWLFGHWHYNYVNEDDGVLNISTAKPDGGGINGSPNGIRVVNIEGGKVKSAQMSYGYENAGTETPPVQGQKWETKLNGRGFWGKPIVNESNVYIATATDSYPNTNAIYGLNAENGKINWSYPVKNSIRNNITLYEGKILALDSEGILYCVNADTGVLIWQNDLGLADPRNTDMNTVADGGKVYVGNTYELFCFNADNGGTVWYRDESDGTELMSSPSQLVISGNNLIVHCHWRRVFALDKNTGNPVWSNEELSGCFSSVVPNGDKLLFQSGSTIAEYDNKSGEITRSAVIDGYVFDSASTPYIDGTIAYIGSANKGAIAFDLQSFKEIWRFTGMSVNLIYTSQYSKGDISTIDGDLTEKDGKLYFGGLDGYIYSLDKTGGKLLKSINIGAPILTDVVFSDNNLLVFDFDGVVRCIDKNMF